MARDRPALLRQPRSTHVSVCLALRKRFPAGRAAERFATANSDLNLAVFPSWTTALCWILIGVAIACAVLAALDVMVRPQKMWIMNVVWPLVMLFGSVIWLWFYARFARAPRRRSQSDKHGRTPSSSTRHPFAISVATDTNHCGAGCALGDIVGETLLALMPGAGALVGLGSLYGQRPVPGWILGTLLAFAFGVVFQYFAIAPMHHLGLWAGVLRALKADAASIAAWQIGMIGTMALIQLFWLPRVLGGFASPSTPQFWVFMQVAMVLGYACSYPVNWWLVRAEIKDEM